MLTPATITPGAVTLAGLADAHPELFTVANAMESRGIRIHLVGGPVRDTLSGTIPNDLDVTSAATPETFRAAINAAHHDNALEPYHVSVYDVGETHGTTGVALTDTDGNVSIIEHTTHRREVYTENSRTPEVSFGDNLIEDLARRDFTLNAIAIDLITGDTCDPHNGIADLTEAVLRCCDTPEVTFSEDPLRIARLVRFAAQHGYRIATDTADAAATVARRLDIISVERRRDEMVKMAANATTLAAALRTAHALGIDEAIFGLTGAALDTIDVYALEDATTPHRTYGIAVLAVASGDAPTWARRWKYDRATISTVRATQNAIRSVEAGEPASVAVRLTGSVAAARLTAAVAEATQSGAAGALREAVKRADVLCAPLTVDGRDAIAAGLTGPAIGTVLAELNRRHALRGGLDRATALRELAELAAAQLAAAN